jgi:biopolymer transport protein ExbD
MNIVPLIDVLLVLLIIFMAISPIKPHKLESKLPKPPDGVHGPELSLVVSMEADPTGRISTLRLNLDSVSEEGLSERLREILTPRPTDARTVFIRAPRHTLYGEVARVIDLVKDAGARPMGLQIDELP